MIGYCEKCEEYRTDTSQDAWGFVWNGAAPQCQRCGSIVEPLNNSQHDEFAAEFNGEDESE